jgi:hypothetical protein
LKITRRSFVQNIAGACAVQNLIAQHFEFAYGAMREVFEAPYSLSSESNSHFFGITQSYKLRDSSSYYSVPETITPQNRLCFDVSNNRIGCSVNSRGLLERLAIELGVEPVETTATPVGAYVEKVLLRAGPCPLLVGIGDAAPIRLDTLPQPEILLHDTLFPVYVWQVGQLRLQMLVFAPETAFERDIDAPCAVCARFTLESAGGEGGLPVRISIPQASMEPIGTAQDGIVLAMAEKGNQWSMQALGAPLEFQLGPSMAVTAALVFASDAENWAKEQARIAAKSGSEWFEETWRFHRSRLGQLSIPAEPFYAELYVRAAELCRQSLMLDGDGNFGGSFNGSDLPVASNVWMRDCFYSTLPQSFLNPELCAKAILFFLRHSIPSRVLGEHADKFPGATGITNSLGNSVAGIVLAGMYFAHNGDTAFFRKNPEIHARSLTILEQVLASRRGDTFLFPSVYVSDGESRGDYHTGSNIFLWRAFSSFARLAAEVYEHSDLAAEWEANAQRLREAILANCVVTEDDGIRFVEGAMQDHTEIGGHDAEESDVTLASFYEFCKTDDKAYLNAAREAISPSNPYAIKEVEGVWWYAHGKWSSATFPGWTTALASSTNEAELIRHLERIRTLTDADGSFWWWPYPHELQPKIEHPLRTNSKCAWAAGVYVCYFTRHILGLSVDMPSHRLSFRPLLPWSEYSWKNCRLGGVEFDCSYVRREGDIAMTVRNRSSQPLEVSFGAILPKGARILQTLRDKKAVDSRQMNRYGRTAAEMTVSVACGAQMSYRVEFGQSAAS